MTELITLNSGVKLMDKKTNLQNQIHTALIELCALADAEDKVLDLNIETHYLNSAGKVQCNAVLACDVKFIDKGEL